MIMVHLVFNAHIDPVWLWPWQSGLDEAIATCRSACDRLDAHPELIFSRGEAWIYQQIEKTDPRLFDRIVAHVQSGRWEIVGGWWIQPDCNAPSGFAMKKQIALGKEYFQKRFGFFPAIGYNVDSFGHAATLPGYMHTAGQTHYVMMRPQEHEKSLPARLFRWRGYADGPQVVTFRIATAYACREITEKYIRDSMTELPAGIEHTMCFVGVGDHGGGPTEGQIQWIKQHADAFDGCRLVFSSPRRFFDAVAGDTDKLPLVTGELQMHAVGCYSVYRPVKTALRRAEHKVRQAEIMNASVNAHADAALHEAWRRVCFNQFHDALGGTCIPSAYPQVLAQLGYAQAVADDVLQLGLRRKMTELPDDALQRIVAFNASDAPFDDWIEVEPWLDWRKWEPGWQLLDEQGRAIPYQWMQSEAQAAGLSTRLLFRSRIEAADWRVFRICPDPAVMQPHDAVTTATVNQIANAMGTSWTVDELHWPDGAVLAMPRLELIEDRSDTWSHSLDRYGQGATAQWDAPTLMDRGPVMASLSMTGTIGRSRLNAEWRVYAGEAFVELLLGVHWLEYQHVLKLTLPLTGEPDARIDGILGGQLLRPNNGQELPMRDWMLIPAGDGRDGCRVGVVCPDVYAADVTTVRARLTLLRSPLMAHHDPHPPTINRPRVSDQGDHFFRFRFYGGRSFNQQRLDRDAIAMQRPPVLADLTRGMPRHCGWDCLSRPGL